MDSPALIKMIKSYGLNLNLFIPKKHNLTTPTIRKIQEGFADFGNTGELIIDWFPFSTRFITSISVNQGERIDLLKYRGEISIKTGDILAHYTPAGNWAGKVQYIGNGLEEDINILIINATWEGSYNSLVTGVSGFGIWEVDGSSGIVETNLYHKPIPWKIFEIADRAVDLVDYHKNPFYQYPDEKEEALRRILELLMEIKKEREDLYQAKHILENI